MGALRHVSRRVRFRTVLAAIGFAGTAVAGVAACDPVDGVNTASVAYTTDRTATSALEHHGVGVDWLSCTADSAAGTGAPSAPPSTAAHDVAQVDCQGRTKSKQDITVKGKVTRTVDGRCVQGDLTSTVGGQLAFTATLLGNCAAPPPDTTTPPPARSGGSGGAAHPTETVTVTATVTRYPGK
ncbi:hypothetical protein [Streptomyces sp. NBC_01089]|uniref:hypothetical protein n=1 Tax=Streptomyces sp. NBC_01089 TaxID=2903747 RepID=UPI003864A43D|nr:hypothetical protein OG510_25980 [Streptomyces sp. NBC_01089]